MRYPIQTRKVNQQMSFKSAHDKGRLAGIDICRGKAIEDVVLYHMRNNPYKGKVAQKQFIEGVSEFCNEMEAYRNHRMNERS